MTFPHTLQHLLGFFLSDSIHICGRLHFPFFPVKTSCESFSCTVSELALNWHVIAVCGPRAADEETAPSRARAPATTHLAQHGEQSREAGRDS